MKITKKEFNLSEKRKKLLEHLTGFERQIGAVNDREVEIIQTILKLVEEQDKEFIKRLKEFIRETPNIRKYIVQEEIDKLIGKRLK